jgi:hypothetical protein
MRPLGLRTRSSTANPSPGPRATFHERSASRKRALARTTGDSQVPPGAIATRGGPSRTSAESRRPLSNAVRSAK